MIEVLILRYQTAGYYAWPWWDADGVTIRQNGGYVVVGSELRRATMLEF